MITRQLTDVFECVALACNGVLLIRASSVSFSDCAGLAKGRMPGGQRRRWRFARPTLRGRWLPAHRGVAVPWRSIRQSLAAAVKRLWAWS